LTREQKREFANDPENLLAVGKIINIEKSDKGPDEWRPPNKAFWREYAKKYKHIKMKYGLRITSSEDRALNETIN